VLSAGAGDRVLQFGLAHLRAPLDAELLGVVVELLAGAARRAFARLLAARLEAELPRVELFDFDFDSPERAFSLFTVRAAISLARLVERPSFFSLLTTSLY